MRSPDALFFCLATTSSKKQYDLPKSLKAVAFSFQLSDSEGNFCPKISVLAVLNGL